MSLGGSGRTGPGSQVPAAPFAEYVNKVYEQEKRRCALFDGEQANITNVSQNTAHRLGWDHVKSPTRQIYRYRYLRHEIKGGGVKLARKWSLATVEETMFRANIDMRTYYEEWAARKEGQRCTARELLNFLHAWEDWDIIVSDMDRIMKSGVCEVCREESYFDDNGECIWCAGRREEAARRQKRYVDERRREKRQSERAAA